MKKLRIVTLIVFLFSIFSFSVCALEQSELVSLEIPYLCATPVKEFGGVDGKILQNKSFHANQISIREGESSLKITHSDPEEEGSAAKIFLSYDFQFLRVTVCINEGFSLQPVFVDGYSSKMYRFEVKIGVKNSYPEALSYLENVYLFSAKDLSCTDAFGSRTLHTSEGKTFVGSVSTLYPNTERPYCENGIVWNGEKYRSEAILIASTQDVSMLFECKIPLGDLMQTAPNTTLPMSENAGELFCGGFMLETAIAKNSSSETLPLLCGLRSANLCPFSDEKITWSEYLAETIGLEKSLIPEKLMLPLCFASCPNVLKNNEPIPEENDAVIPSDSNVEFENMPFNPKPTVTSKDTFQGLPQQGEIIPEESEIIFKETKKNEQEETKSIGSILLLIAGIFLFVSVVGTAILFRIMEQKEKNDKEKKKTSTKP